MRSTDPAHRSGHPTRARSDFCLRVADFQVYNNPTCSFASSDILLMSHVGSHTTSTQASLTPGTVFALALTSPGRLWAAGQAGVYRLRVLGQWFDGIRFYAAASSPRRSRRTWAGLR